MRNSIAGNSNSAGWQNTQRSHQNDDSDTQKQLWVTKFEFQLHPAAEMWNSPKTLRTASAYNKCEEQTNQIFYHHSWICKVVPEKKIDLDGKSLKEPHTNQLLQVQRIHNMGISFFLHGMVIIFYSHVILFWQVIHSWHLIWGHRKLHGITPDFSHSWLWWKIWWLHSKLF